MWYALEVVVPTTLVALYYSVDGLAEQVYTGPISINNLGDHTIDYRAVDKAGNISAVQTHKVTLSNASLLLGLIILTMSGSVWSITQLATLA